MGLGRWGVDLGGAQKGRFRSGERRKRCLRASAFIEGTHSVSLSDPKFPVSEYLVFGFCTPGRHKWGSYLLDRAHLSDLLFEDLPQNPGVPLDPPCGE